MKWPKRNIPAVLAATLLATVTLGAFYKLRYFGPESAIIRFNEAIKSNDANALRSVSIDLQGDKVAYFVREIYDWDAHNYPMQIGRIFPNGNEASVAVVFSFPDGTIQGMIWVVERVGQTWRVNANKTATIRWDEKHQG